MPILIKDKRIAADSWKRLDGRPDHYLRPADDGLLRDFPPGDLLVTLAVWKQRRDDLVERAGRTGVLLEPGDDPAAIAADLGHLDLVAVNFPDFTDGRGHTIARLLRERHGYEGEVRAVGDVLRDALFYLNRCGFDAFELADARNAAQAVAGLADFSDAYQASVERPLPLFRRRPGNAVQPAARCRQ